MAVFAALILTPRFIVRRLGEAQGSTQTEEKGEIRPNQAAAWLIVILGAIVAVGGAVLFFPIIGPMALSTALGAVFASLAIPSLAPGRIVRWDRTGLEGPVRPWPNLGRNRVRIAWSQIRGYDLHPLTDSWYVEARDGRRVYWNARFPGYWALNLALRRRCPWLWPRGYWEETLD